MTKEFREAHSALAFPTAETFRFQFPEPYYTDCLHGDEGIRRGLKDDVIDDVVAYAKILEGMRDANVIRFEDVTKYLFKLYHNLDVHLGVILGYMKDSDIVLPELLDTIREEDDTDGEFAEGHKEREERDKAFAEVLASTLEDAD